LTSSPLSSPLALRAACTETSSLSDDLYVVFDGEQRLDRFGFEV
jgi:hypothetical protein